MDSVFPLLTKISFVAVGVTFVFDVVRVLFLKETIRFREKPWFFARETIVLCLLAYMAVHFGIGSWKGMSLVLGVVGSGLAILGATINVWARLELGSNWAGILVVYRKHRLIRTGPYRYVRHPLYSSLFLLILGAGLTYRNLAVLAIAFFFFGIAYLRACDEEKFLCKHLDGYRKYVAGVRRFFPFPSARVEEMVDISPELLRLCRYTTAGALLFVWFLQWYFMLPFFALSFWWGGSHGGRSLIYSAWEKVLSGRISSRAVRVSFPAIRFAQWLGAGLLLIATYFFLVQKDMRAGTLWLFVVMVSSFLGGSGYCMGMKVYAAIRKLNE